MRINLRTHVRFLAIQATVGFLSVMAVLATHSTTRAQSFLIGGFGDGIYASNLDEKGGMSTPVRVAEQHRPAFFAFHPKESILYCVTETMQQDKAYPAVVVAYRVDQSGLKAPAKDSLVKFSSQKVAGDIPCHVAVDPKAEFVTVANYTSGSVILYPLQPNGTIEPACDTVQHRGSSVNKSRQEGPHAHCTVWDPTHQFVLAADLGIDQVLVYKIDRANKKLVPSAHPFAKTAPGAGPRHLSFSPDGKFLYIINELNMTLSVAGWDPSQGKLTMIDSVSTLPADAKGDNFSTAEVLVHPTGKFVYSSNRGHHTIASFAVETSTGKLRPTGHTSTQGKTPRNFRLNPSGKFLLAENQDSNTIYSYAIDPETGTLTPTGSKIEAPAPACIKFVE